MVASLPRKSIQASGKTVSVTCRRSVHLCFDNPLVKTTAAQQLDRLCEKSGRWGPGP
jgi:hypothetical protein